MFQEKKRLQLVYKLIFSFVVILFLSCTEIERDNILDPKNPRSKSESVIFIEAFVNTAHPTPFNSYALDAIEILKATYQDRLIIAELHRNVSDASDTLTIAETDILHTRYTTDYILDPGRNKGVPDIFLNGAENRVQGSFDVANVVSRLQVITESLFLNTGNFTIEADAEYSGISVVGKYRIAALGNNSAGEMVLRILTTYNSEQVYGTGGTGKNTVSAVESISITGIDEGEYVEESFSINVDQAKVENIVFVLMDNSQLLVLHAFEKEIP